MRLTLIAATAAIGDGRASSPGIPASSVKPIGPTQLKYCVTGYAPTSVVRVKELGGTTATIRTDNHGSGCTSLPLSTGCTSGGTDRSAVATGVGADGNPATSRASVSSATGATSCASATAAGRGSTASNSSALGAGGVLVVVLVVVVVIGAASGFWLARRRRRTAA